MVIPAAIHPVTFVLASAAVVIGVSTVPYAVSAIDYRHRDNGLAYILFVMGVGVWNGMFAAQLLTADPIVDGFFYALSVVGSVLAGLGFLLFALTASSTRTTLARRDVYTVVGVLAGIDIGMAVTTPAHGLYWRVLPADASSLGVAAVAPRFGYWFHTALLATFIAGGVLLFDGARRRDAADGYLRAYVVVGSVTVLGLLASAVLAPGGLAVAAVLSGVLTSIAWLQATRGRPLETLRDRGGALRVTLGRSP